MQGWKILKISICPTSPYVLVNSIINIGNVKFSTRPAYLPWRADEWIFPALACKLYSKASKPQECVLDNTQLRFIS